MATESLLRIMKNAFYFTSKALYVLKIFKFLSCLFGQVAKQIKFKFYDVTAWLTKIRNTHIDQYLEK